MNTNVDSLKQNVRNLVDEGQERVSAIKDRVIDVKDQAMSKGGVALDRVTDYIKGHPLQAVGIAFGLGYIGMRLFRR